MSDEKLDAFIAAVKADAGLQEKLKETTDADAIAAIAKAEGFLISAEALSRVQAEVSEEDLASVAGGSAGSAWSPRTDDDGGPIAPCANLY